MADRFFIGPMTGGVQGNLKPWMISDQAYEVLRNMYEWRGRLKKRFGTNFTTGSSDNVTLNSRLRILIDTTSGAGLAAGNLPLNTGDMAIGMMFSIDTDCYTITALGNPATVIGTGGATLTIDTTASPATYSITGAPATTAVYFYPCLPVMGIVQYDREENNNETTIVWDTRFAYTYDGTGWNRIGTYTWSGDSSQFFSAVNWFGANLDDYNLYAVNYDAADFIQFWNGTTWTSLQPVVNSGSGATLDSARILKVFQNRLLAFNTIESTGTYTNRVRYSQNGDPRATNAWYEDVKGLGGFINAPTKESITGVEIIRDRCIVYFEQSTYELVWTNNDIVPFVFQQINANLGVESPFSTIVMEDVILGLGNTGIHACNGTSVERIDDIIPSYIWEISNLNDGVLRSHGIRDFFTEYIYWTVPAGRFNNNIFPTQILAYNYKTGSFALFDDSYTTFGYIQFPVANSGSTWTNQTTTWNQSAWQWNSIIGTQLDKRILTGNQQGWVSVINPFLGFLAPSLQITDIDISSPPNITITCVNHNLTNESYIYIQESEGITGVNDKIFPIESITDANTFVVDWDYDEAFPTGTYTGCGIISLISPIEILTKQYNFYNKIGMQMSIDKIDFNIDLDGNGQLTIDALPSFTQVSTTDDGGDSPMGTGALLGNNVLEFTPYDAAYNPLESVQSQAWHSVYVQGEGEVVQGKYYQTPDQIRNVGIATAPYTINGILYYTRKTSSRFR